MKGYLAWMPKSAMRVQITRKISQGNYNLTQENRKIF